VFLVVRWRQPVDPRRLREQAAAAVKAGSFEDAEVALARLDPKRALDWILQSKVDQARGRPAAALGDLTHIPDSDRLGALARYIEGVILLNDLHQAPAAEAALRRAVALDPTAVPPRQTLCFLYYTLSRKPEFAAEFRALEGMGRVVFDDVYHACVVSRGGTETRQIVDRLQGFLAADPADRRSRLALAEELRGLHRLAEAERVLAVLPASDAAAQAMRACGAGPSRSPGRRRNPGERPRRRSGPGRAPRPARAGPA
jgi:hypothetical protein